MLQLCMMDYRTRYPTDSSQCSDSLSKSSKSDESGPVVFDVDPAQCRICYEGEDEKDEVLISPCNCLGSVQFVHASCLNRWRAQNIDNRNRSVCGLCNSSYRLQTENYFDILFHRKGRAELGSFFTRQRLYNAFIKLAVSQATIDA